MAGLAGGAEGGGRRVRVPDLTLRRTDGDPDRRRRGPARRPRRPAGPGGRGLAGPRRLAARPRRRRRRCSAPGCGCADGVVLERYADAGRPRAGPTRAPRWPGRTGRAGGTRWTSRPPRCSRAAGARCRSRELVELLAFAHDRPVDALVAAALPAVRELVRHGLLVPDPMTSSREGRRRPGHPGRGARRRRDRRRDRARPARAARRAPRRRATRPRHRWPASCTSCGSSTASGRAPSTGAPLLVVSQFTLYGDTRKGRRPSWSAAAPPERAAAAGRRGGRRAAGARRDGRDRGVRRGDGRRVGERRPVHGAARGVRRLRTAPARRMPDGGRVCPAEGQALVALRAARAVEAAFSRWSRRPGRPPARCRSRSGR